MIIEIYISKRLKNGDGGIVAIVGVQNQSHCHRMTRRMAGNNNNYGHQTLYFRFTTIKRMLADGQNVSTFHRARGLWKFYTKSDFTIDRIAKIDRKPLNIPRVRYKSVVCSLVKFAQQWNAPDLH